MNYAYWFANVPGISNREKLRLLTLAGSCEELYFLPEEQLALLCNQRKEAAARIAESRKTDTEEAYMKMCGRGISFVSLEDETYPGKLRQIPDAPIGLYVKGKLPERGKKSVAIVGARMCSEYGRAVAYELGQRLAACGVTVVSGMARGIDAAGHNGALAAYKTGAAGMTGAPASENTSAAGCITCAVLGCGVDVCYPASNRKLYGEILGNGCIVSEFAPGTEPFPAFFPQRNRIISGLSDVTVVVEARAKSGSLITADAALEQGRDIYAVPGRITDPLSAGCNHLIEQGAGILGNVEEFLKVLDLCGAAHGRQETLEKLLLEKEERMVYSCVDLRPKSMEELLQKTHLTMPEMAQALAGLLQKGFITETFKNCYIRRI